MLGHIEVEAKVTGLRFTKILRMIIDTGSAYLVLPPSLTEEIGAIRLPFKTKASLANGQELSAETTVWKSSLRREKFPPSR